MSQQNGPLGRIVNQNKLKNTTGGRKKEKKKELNLGTRKGTKWRIVVP